MRLAPRTTPKTFKQISHASMDAPMLARGHCFCEIWLVACLSCKRRGACVGRGNAGHVFGIMPNPDVVLCALAQGRWGTK